MLFFNIFLKLNIHLHTEPSCLLEMILQSDVEIKSVSSVPKANSYESTAACMQHMV